MVVAVEEDVVRAVKTAYPAFTTCSEKEPVHIKM